MGYTTTFSPNHHSLQLLEPLKPTTSPSFIPATHSTHPKSNTNIPHDRERNPLLSTYKEEQKINIVANSNSSNLRFSTRGEFRLRDCVVLGSGDDGGFGVLVYGVGLGGI